MTQKPTLQLFDKTMDYFAACAAHAVVCAALTCFRQVWLGTLFDAGFALFFPFETGSRWRRRRSCTGKQTVQVRWWRRHGGTAS